MASNFYENVKRVEGNHENNWPVIDHILDIIIKTKKVQKSVFNQRFTFFIQFSLSF